jgi:short-subunit dehydrogenase
MNLRDRVVVVTGASSGIGAATARALARRRVRAVALVARGAEALGQVAAEVRALGAEAVVCPADLADAAAAEGAARAVVAAAGVPDVLVNNAGAGRWLFVEETPPGEEAQMMAAPYFAAFNATRAFLPGMLARGSGRIVNVTSPAAYAPWAGATGYIAARWAMRGFGEALRADLHGSGVGVTLFTPGKVSSSYFEHNPGAEERIPGIARLFRTLTPEEAAEALVRAIERDAREVVTPALLRLTVWFQRLFPGAVRGLMIRTGATGAGRRRGSRA